jgi:hypothetical protein
VLTEIDGVGSIEEIRRRIGQSLGDAAK